MATRDAFMTMVTEAGVAGWYFAGQASRLRHLIVEDEVLGFIANRVMDSESDNETGWDVWVLSATGLLKVTVDTEGYTLSWTKYPSNDVVRVEGSSAADKPQAFPGMDDYRWVSSATAAVALRSGERLEFSGAEWAKASDRNMDTLNGALDFFGNLVQLAQ